MSSRLLQADAGGLLAADMLCTSVCVLPRASCLNMLPRRHVITKTRPDTLHKANGPFRLLHQPLSLAVSHFVLLLYRMQLGEAAAMAQSRLWVLPRVAPASGASSLRHRRAAAAAQ